MISVKHEHARTGHDSALAGRGMLCSMLCRLKRNKSSIRIYPRINMYMNSFQDTKRGREVVVMWWKFRPNLRMINDKIRSKRRIGWRSGPEPRPEPAVRIVWHAATPQRASNARIKYCVPTRTPAHTSDARTAGRRGTGCSASALHCCNQSAVSKLCARTVLGHSGTALCSK